MWYDLRYHYRINPKLLKTLEEMTADLPHIGVNTSKRGNYPMCHYIVWRDYSKELYESADYQKELPASKERYNKNSKLFEYLSDRLLMISLMTYVNYGEAKLYL